MRKQTALSIRRKRLARRARAISKKTGLDYREIANLSTFAKLLDVSQTKAWMWFRYGPDKSKDERRIVIMLDRIEAKLDEVEK